jgi:LysM repeat protein
MGAKLIAAFVGFVLVVLFLQSYVFGGDEGGLDTSGRGGAQPTATLPAQLPAPIVLAETAGGTGGGATTGNTGAGSTRAYVVKSGDTLGAIATSLGVPPDQQAAWIAQVLDINDIADARNIQVGVELQVPAPAPTPRPSATVRPTGSTTPQPSGTAAATQRPGTTATATARPAGTPTPTPRPAASGDTYTVVSGDTGFGIAEKCGVDEPGPWLNELEELNDIDAGNLKVGQELTLPAGTGDCG